MTNLEKHALKTVAKEIRRLASLERAGFCSNKEKNEEIKRQIKPYMQWFESAANDIERIVELTEKSGPCKKYELEEIIRLNL